VTERVCIANADKEFPTYHKIGEIAVEGRSDWVWLTACNIAEINTTYGIKSIRREYAALFARPTARLLHPEGGPS